MFKSSPRREREHQQHIKHILNMAESIFAERGFFRTTMHQIALKAEFALGTIYSYFGSKKQLYEKVIETKVNELVAFVSKEMADARSVQGQIKKFISAKMTFLHENWSFLRLYLGQVDVPRIDVDHILPEAVREKYDSMLRDLTAVMWRGIQQGLLKPLDAKLIAKTLDGFTNAFALSHLGSGAPTSIDAAVAAVTELFLHGIAKHQQQSQNSDNRKELGNGS